MKHFLILLTATFAFAFHSQAQTKEKLNFPIAEGISPLNIIPDDSIAIEINPYLFYARSDSLTNNRPLLGDWKPLTSSATRFSSKQVWFQFQLFNPDTTANYAAILYLGELQEVKLTQYAHNSNTSDRMMAGTLIPFKDRQTKRGFILEGYGNSAQIALELEPGLHTFLLQTKSLYDQSFSPQIKLYPLQEWTKTVNQSRENHLFFQALILGALLILSIYHFFIFLQKWDTAFLLYAIYTFLSALIFFLEMGLAPLYFFEEQPAWILKIKDSLAITFITAVVYFLFMREFIRLKELLPKMDKLLRWYLIITIPPSTLLILLYLLNPNPLVRSLGHIFPIIALVLGIFYIIAIWRSKDPLGIYFIIGSSFLVFGTLANTILFSLQEAGIVGKLPFPRNYLTEIGALMEIIIFALGLGYRLRMQEKEKQEVEELNQMKSTFFANISHEFRTPLTVISGSAAQIKGNELERKLIRRNSKSLLQLVNQLLDLSRLESGVMNFHNIRADIIPYLQYLTESLHTLASDKDVQLLFYPEQHSLEMDFDEEKIQHIIYNLLSNAIKFTNPKGKVVLHARREQIKNKHWIQLKVSDTGIGIPPEVADKIFDRFYQVDHNIAQGYGGTGIGLALTKDLIELMGGKISVDSKLGIGTNFHISLPVRQQAEATAPQYLASFLTKEPEISQPIQSPFPNASKENAPQLLIIEDNADVVTYIQSFLEKDYHISIARDGQMGIDLAIESIPDIIISDVLMPEKNGYEVCQTLKKDERTSHIPIILLTAKATEEERIEGLREGADAYLTKPFNKEELLVRLNKLIELRDALQVYYTKSDVLFQVTQNKENPSSEDLFLQKLITVVKDRLDDPKLSVTDLCRAANLSNMQVNRKLKALTGKTPSLFIRSIRLHKGRELLLGTNSNVSEIAYDVGFSDPNYFSRTFLEEFGMSPSDMRK